MVRRDSLDRDSLSAEDFSLLLRSRRSAAELTQEELAQKSGVSVRAISDMETGRTGQPHMTSARLLADALGLLGAERQHFVQAASGGRNLPGASGLQDPVTGRSGTVPVPRQLPSALPQFAVREPELATLDGLLRRRSGSTSAMIVVIAGTAGVGKTALTVQWAHRVRGTFPDGQLYANLRGFGPSTPTPATRILRCFLEALGVPPERVPADIDEQAGMYRSLLADRRLLVLLDNARDAAQVRPLVPGTPGCAVVVTTRMRLTGLVASDGASELTLNALSGPDARVLLTRRLGAARLAAEPAAAQDLIAASAGLPLALATIAAFAARNPESPLRELAARYASARGPFDQLSSHSPRVNPQISRFRRCAARRATSRCQLVA